MGNNIAKILAKNMSSTHKIDPLWKLLFPNSLSNEELRESLMKMGFDAKTEDRDELLDLFLKNVMPKPQREIYKNNFKRKVKIFSETSETENGSKRKLEESLQIEEANGDSAKKRFKAKSRISFP